MRVSTTEMANRSLYGIMSAYERFNTAQNEVNTGKQVQVPSDDPAGTAQSLDFRQNVSEIDQYSKTMDQAQSFMSTSDSALDNVNTLLLQARSIALQGATDSISSDTRAALAGQMQNIIDQLGNIGNTTYGSRYVFGGQLTSTPPFAAAGSGSYTYSGGTAAAGNQDINLDIGKGETMTVNVTGDKILAPLIEDQAGPPAVKSILGQLRDDISTGNSSQVSRVDIAALDTQTNVIQAANADFGSKIDRIGLTQQRDASTKVNFTQLISNIEDANIPQAVINLQSAQTAYQAALQSTAKSFQYSLLNFLQ